MSAVKSVIPQPLSSQAPGGSDARKLLSLSFNNYTFYKLSDIIAHIHDYPVGLQRTKLYCDVVEQAVGLFDIGSVFAAGLIKAVKRDKSWAVVDWDAKDVAELLEPLTR